MLFPADTVYGLAVDPGNEDAIERMYRAEGTAPREEVRRVMYFLVDAVPDLPERGDGACSPGRSR